MVSFRTSICIFLNQKGPPAESEAPGMKINISLEFVYSLEHRISGAFIWEKNYEP